jgi:hypothetical protein
LNNEEENPMKKIALIAGIAALIASPALADVAAEISTAQTHAGMASTQADIAMAQKHLHHAVNCLVGPSGAGFDAAAGNPCAKAGNGAIPDSTNAAQKAKLEAAVKTATPGLTGTDLAATQAAAKATADEVAAAK